MNTNFKDSENLIKNMAKILEDIEIDDIEVQQSINDIRDASNQLNKNEINFEIRELKSNN